MRENLLKLAYISPLPPEKSGISFYSKELIPYLDKYYNISLVIDQQEVDPELAKNYEVIRYDDFLKRYKEFDRILCHFGNSSFHKHMLYLIEKIPCAVVLHDIFISGLINWAHHTEYYPDLLLEEAYCSHGWSSILEMKNDLHSFIMKYPLNSRVINNSVGVIIHSNHALELIKSFYRGVREERFKIIPHLRSSINLSGEYEVKDVFISSFGHITPFKLPRKILKAFALSKVSRLPNATLCFVGKPSPSHFEHELLKLAEALKIRDKVVITGFVDKETYIDYLSKSLICVQLRTNSRGETSGAALDVLSAGKPLIVNAYGSFKEFPEEVCYFVSEDPAPEEIAKAIDSLYQEESLRKKFSQKALQYIKNFHSPERIATLFYEAIEDFYQKNLFPEFLEKLAKAIKRDELKKFVCLIKKNFSPTVKNSKLFVDVSVISSDDFGTGIQRVVKAQLKGLLENPPEGFRVEPIRLTNEDKRWCFKYARNYVSSFLDIATNNIMFVDSEVDFCEGDIYYAPDLNWDVIETYKIDLYYKLKLIGVKIIFLIYDLLIIEFPDYFPQGAYDLQAKYLKSVLEISDLILCISSATAESLKKFAKREGIYRENLKIDVLHLGCDIEKAKHKADLSLKDIEVFQQVSRSPYFLMVSTLEPRKGHFQTIKAFEILWKEGLNINLVIVGKQGWMVEKLIEYIQSHSELDKKLFWLGYVSDDLLAHLYKNALATIIASEGEGFGLSIIESAYYSTPVIARDISVFREVAKEGAYYFPNSKDPKVLAEALKDWLKLYKKDQHPKPYLIKWMSWEEHVKKLKDILFHK